MNRRDFLQFSALATAQLTVGCAATRPSAKAPPSVGTAKPFEYEEATIAQLQAAMNSGKETAASLAKKFLDRIVEVDRRGPKLNSFIELNPDAVALARALDAERKANGPRGPLHGIPVVLKDNIDTHDRMTTTAGSLALAGSIPLQDSFVARKLRDAGAVILGKTNLSEWANFRSSHSTSGWSGRGGQTKNPYVLDRNPCGSSSGTGAAVAANLCAVGVGTETDGSVVCPSNANSLVGIKPTVGLVSRAGIVPIAHSQDTAGPMARTVTDAAILLTALAGIDPDDSITTESQGKSSADYTQILDANGLRGARIGVPRKSFGFSDHVDQLMNSPLAAMKRLGAEIIDPAEIETAGKFDDSELDVLLFELKADLNKYLAGLGPRAPVHTLKDVIEFNDRSKDKELPYFGQDLFIKAEAKGPLTDKVYLDALAKNHRMSRDEGIDAVMTKNKLDAMVAPTGGPPWPTDLINGDHFTGGFFTPSAGARYSHLTLPAW